MAQTIHRSPFPDPVKAPDLDTLKDLYREMYNLRAPLLTYKILENLSVEPDRDDLYNDARTVDRKYVPPEGVPLRIFGPLDPETFDFGFWGIDTKRALLNFSLCVPLLEDLSIVCKPGDVIMYDGTGYEIETIKRMEDAYFAHTNYAFEVAVAAFIPTQGS